MILSLLLLSGRTTRQIRLVLTALGMSEIRAIVLMNGQTETALEASNVVLEEVGIFIEIDRLESKLAQTLTTVSVRRGLRCDTTATEFGTCAVLKRTLDDSL